VGRATAEKVIGQMINEVVDRCDVCVAIGCRLDFGTYESDWVTKFSPL